MGAGVALQAKQRFPGLPSRLGRYVARYGNRVFLVEDMGIISFPTKENWKDKSDMVLIVKSAGQLMDLMDKFGIESVVMTRPGCGNGGLRWEDVKPVIEKYLDDRVTIVNPK